METLLAILLLLRDFFRGLVNFITGVFIITYILLAPVNFAIMCLLLIAIYSLYCSLKESVEDRLKKRRHSD